MSTPEIKPGCWVMTSSYGPAVCVAVQEHHHGLEDRPGKYYDGTPITIAACDDDQCKYARMISFRYPAKRPGSRKNIWVYNGALNQSKYESVTFLRPATSHTRRILKLKGPYGQG